MRKEIELLAPAGSKESLIAAIQNGANAVYQGGQSFSARASANNFSDEELAEAVLYAHFRDVRIYVTVNTLLDERELEKAVDYIYYLDTIGVDGIIVQDLGLAKVIKENFSNLELHASTQMTINSLEGGMFLEKNGFNRIVLARETPLSEIKLMKENLNLQIEAFAHGALCISYSGQCLMSSMIGGRSGNRGRCAQPCRKSYEIIKKDGEVLKDSRGYLISPKDLYTLENLEKLIDAGVDSIKIEGRMKRPEYVATVINSYRKGIDGLSIKGEEKLLKQAFNRGFTKGLPFNDFGKNLVDSTRPDNRGLKVGDIIDFQNRNAVVEFFEDINEGDLLEFQTQNGHKTINANKTYPKGKAIIPVYFKVIKQGEVRRIHNMKHLEKARKTYEVDNKKREIDLKFIAHIGEYPKLKLVSREYEEEVLGDKIVEESINSPATFENIQKQLEKLGNTGFILKNLEIDIEDNIFMPVGVLNSLRRDIIEKLEDRIRKNTIRKSQKININKNPKSIEKTKIKFSVSLDNKEQFEKIKIGDIDRFYLRFLDVGTYKSLLEKGKEVYYRSPKILFHKDYNSLKEQTKHIPMTGVVIDNLGGFIAFGDENLIGDMGLNIFNSHGIDFLRENNMKDIILSPELTFHQISEIRRRTDATLESIGYGFLRVMTMKHCPFSLIKKCEYKRNCEVCNFKEGYTLRDEKNVDFKTKRENDLSIIYNSYPISIIEHLDKVSESGIDYLLLDFTFEENPQEIIDEFVNARYKKTSILNERLKEKWGNITHGHYFRGVD